MTTGNIVFMLVIFGIVWGGFIYCLVSLARQPDDDAPETEVE